jgi:hypothetical protein
MNLNNTSRGHDGFPDMNRAWWDRSVTVVLLFFALLASMARAGDELNRDVRIIIDTEKSIAKVAEDFIGFGYETSAVAQSGFFSPNNTRMINLYGNLSKHGMIRIGGNVSDHTRYVADGISAAKTEKEVTVINRANLNDLGAFVRATGWRVMWGLNLGTGTKDEAVEEAIAVDQALGENLHSFEIGNEVDLLPKYSKDYGSYHRAYADYKAAIRNRLPSAMFSGPDSAGNLEFIKNFVADEAADMKLVTHHYYRTGARKPEATIEFLLARDKAFDTRLDVLQELCGRSRLEYRINEVNSFYGGGKQGVSDTLGSVLWCLRSRMISWPHPTRWRSARSTMVLDIESSFQGRTARRACRTSTRPLWSPADRRCGFTTSRGTTKQPIKCRTSVISNPVSGRDRH